MTRYVAGLSLCLGLGCGAAQPPSTGTPEIESLPKLEQPAPEPAPVGAAPGHGGRLFDKWYAEVGATFVPDDPATEALDGEGGPFDNGTLPGSDGQPMPNTGHDYRLKNLLGWDLRGQQGLYGPDHADKSGVLVPSLLDDTDSREHWIERLTKGGDAFPAYGSVLSAEDIEALVDFLLAVRDGRLPQPDDVYLLTTTTGYYQLRAGGDAERGSTLFAERCAGCHGNDGTEQLFDDGAYSLGTLSRSKGYEVFMKILSGHPGTDMQAQVEGDREAQAQQALDLLTALCDRTRYPAGAATKTDVPDGDPRCGTALK